MFDPTRGSCHIATSQSSSLKTTITRFLEANIDTLNHMWNGHHGTAVQDGTAKLLLTAAVQPPLHSSCSGEHAKVLYTQGWEIMCKICVTPTLRLYQHVTAACKHSQPKQGQGVSYQVQRTSRRDWCLYFVQTQHLLEQYIPFLQLLCLGLNPVHFRSEV